MAEIEIETAKHVVRLNGEEISLTRKEFKILELLSSIPGNVFTRDNIFQSIWEKNSSSTKRTVDVHLVSMRKKLGNDFVKTIKGVGFKLNIKPKVI